MPECQNCLKDFNGNVVVERSRRRIADSGIRQAVNDDCQLATRDPAAKVSGWRYGNCSDLIDRRLFHRDVTGLGDTDRGNSRWMPLF